MKKGKREKGNKEIEGNLHLPTLPGGHPLGVTSSIFHQTSSIFHLPPSIFHLFIFFSFVIITCSSRQNTTAQNYTIASYNVENLFDTFDDPLQWGDDEFLPLSKRQWNLKKYNDKLEKLSEVISQLGDEDGPEIIGLSEVENLKVVEDLFNTKKLQQYNYSIIHQDSPDKRGIDVAFVYKEDIYKPITYKTYTIDFHNEPDYKTRDFLLVIGVLAETDTIIFILNHWPSRSGGVKAEYQREYVASKVRDVVNLIFGINKNSKIIIMGDFNDEPSNKSIYKVLKAKEGFSNLKTGELYNPWYSLEKENQGSYCYRGDWSMLDQIILSTPLVNNKNIHYKINSATIFAPEWLKQHNSQYYDGYPLGTFWGKKYLSGYSDHFPVYIILSK